MEELQLTPNYEKKMNNMGMSNMDLNNLGMGMNVNNNMNLINNMNMMNNMNIMNLMNNMNIGINNINNGIIFLNRKQIPYRVQ